jgi:hypothetical protein
MSDVACRGSFALGTACGQCFVCKALIKDHDDRRAVREKLDGTAALKSQIAALRARLAEVEAEQIMLRAERDGLASMLLSVQQESIAATKALATARRDALEEAAMLVDEMQRRRQVVWPKDIRALIAQEEQTT